MTAAARTDSTAVARTEEPKGIAAIFASQTAKERITPFLRGANFEQVVQEVYLAAGENPKLRECTPASLVTAVARAVKWAGAIGEDVHLVPFAVNIGTKEKPQWEQRAKAIKDYKFKAKLIVETGAARQVYAVAVYANEKFSLRQGTEQAIAHEIILDDKTRGAMVGAYAVARLARGDVQIVSKTIKEIDGVRKSHSKQWKSLDVTPEWYALKTVIHQLAKLLPQNARLRSLLADDEETDPDLGELTDAGALTGVITHTERPVRPIMLNAGYETIPTAERDEHDRPLPIEHTIAESQREVSDVEQEDEILADDRALAAEEGELALGDDKPRRARGRIED